MLRVLIAPQAFKGTASALQVADAISAGMSRAIPDAEFESLPLSDGGDGFLDVILSHLPGQRVESDVVDPWGKRIRAAWGVLDENKTAIIEAAQVVGWARADPKELDPLTASTYGLGELIMEAINFGCHRLVIGLGGTATNDGGAGMAQALGYRLHNEGGQELERGGAPLQMLKHIDDSKIDPRLKNCEFICACDVSAHLLGVTGATQLFAEQKGANREMMVELEKGMANLAYVIREELGKNVAETEGAGAAGGLGAGCAAFLNARLVAGIEWVLNELEVDEQLESCDLVVTGEGCLDGQTLFEKGPVGLARAARRRGVPVVALVGSVRKDYKTVHQEGINSVVVVFPEKERHYKLADRIEDAAEELAYSLMLSIQRVTPQGAGSKK